MTTFRELDGNISLNPNPNSGLERWYLNIRDTPLAKFTIGDLCRACRQELFLENVIPYAINAIRCDPTAGDTYDGELVSAVAGVSTRFWKLHPRLANEALVSLSKALPSLDDEVTAEVEELKERLDPDL